MKDNLRETCLGVKKIIDRWGAGKIDHNDLADKIILLLKKNDAGLSSNDLNEIVLPLIDVHLQTNAQEKIYACWAKVQNYCAELKK